MRRIVAFLLLVALLTSPLVLLGGTGAAAEAPLEPLALETLDVGDAVGTGFRTEDGACFITYRIVSTLDPSTALVRSAVEPDADCTPRLVLKVVEPRGIAGIEPPRLPGQEEPATRAQPATEPPAPSGEMGLLTHRWETQAQAWTWNYGGGGTWDKLTWTRDVQTWQWDWSCAYPVSVDAYGMPGVGWTMTRNVWNYAETSCTRVHSWSEADFHYWTGPCNKWTHGLHAAVRGLYNGAISYDNYYWGCPVSGVTHENTWIYDKQV